MESDRALTQTLYFTTSSVFATQPLRGFWECRSGRDTPEPRLLSGARPEERSGLDELAKNG